MNYGEMKRGIFLERPNRFIARVELEGTVENCHVKNTGRLKELLLPGRTVWVEHCANPARKTKYSLITVEKPLPDMGSCLVNLDSQAPNRVAEEWVRKGADGLFGEISFVKRETRFGNSRFDLYLEAEGKGIFMEVKGVTLDEGGTARFPDAPTKRGVKHVEELAACHLAGYEACILFVIQMKGITRFAPNENTHPAFGAALRAAARMGVKVLAYDCQVTERTMTLDQPVPVCL